MWRLPLFVGVLTVFLCGQAVFSNLLHSSFFNATTNGTSGPLCTSIERHCLKNVSCKSHKCVCPPGTKGNGQFECIKKSDMLCVVAADPHLITFANATVDVDLPCTYRLTRFVTDHRSKYTQFAHCAVEVLGTNVLSGGRYYVGSVDISVGIVDSGRHIKDVFEIHSDGTNDGQVYRYRCELNHTRVLWGSSVRENLTGWHVNPTFDKENNFAVLEVPECELRIKYRAFPPGVRRQSQLPGISIMAPNDSEFVPGYGDYPEALCGTGKETVLVFHKRAKELGLKNTKLVPIYDILNNAHPQKGNGDAAICDEAFDVFSLSNRQVDDVNYCGDILIHNKQRLCIVATAESYRPITVFLACMRLRQGSSGQDCSIVKSAQAQCGDDWRGPDITCTP